MTLIFRISLLAFAVSCCGQNGVVATASKAPVRSLRDVKSGMSREAVMAGLSESYVATREDDAILPGLEELSLFPKAPQRQGESVDDYLERLPSGEISFWEGKVFSVVIHLRPILTSDEDVRFAKQLFFLLYDQAEPPDSQDALQRIFAKVGNRRKIMAPMELIQHHSPTGDFYELAITVNGEVYTLGIASLAGTRASVSLKRQLFYTPPTPSK